jgi:hypothetical protein
MTELMIFRVGKYAQEDWPKERVRKMVTLMARKNIEAQ